MSDGRKYKILFSFQEVDLQRDGVSADGARKFLAGEEVPAFSDRQRLAQIMYQSLGLTGGAGESALLLPAVQKIREAAARIDLKLGWGFTLLGAQQFFSGQMVSRAEDRRCLAAVLAAIFISTAGGGVWKTTNF